MEHNIFTGSRNSSPDTLGKPFFSQLQLGLTKAETEFVVSAPPFMKRRTNLSSINWASVPSFPLSVFALCVEAPCRQLMTSHHERKGSNRRQLRSSEAGMCVTSLSLSFCIRKNISSACFTSLPCKCQYFAQEIAPVHFAYHTNTVLIPLHVKNRLVIWKSGFSPSLDSVLLKGLF